MPYKVALITGQDGAYLADFLLKKGYAVHCIKRRVYQFNTVAAKEIGIQIQWQRQDLGETGTDSHCKVIVRVDQRYFWPTEVERLLGYPTKAQKKLGWTTKTTFDELTSEMVREDLKAVKRDELVENHGYASSDYHE